MSSRLLRRGLIGAALVAGLVVPAGVKAPAPTSLAAKTTGQDSIASTSSAPAPRIAVEPPAQAPASPVEAAPPPALALAPAGEAPAGAVAAIDAATAPPAPALDAVTEAVRRFAEPVDAPVLALDAERLRAVVAAYRGGDLAGGDGLARALSDPAMRLAADWAAIRLQPRKAGLARLRAFQSALPDWPSAKWIERRIEESLYGDRKDAAAVLAAFRDRAPETLFGEAALARAELAQGLTDRAAARAKRIWRDTALSETMQQAVEREFGALLAPADHKARSDLLFYAEKPGAALAAAKAAGEGALKLAQARALAGTKGFEAAVAALPKEAQADPSLLFARAQAAASAEKYADAAKALLAAPDDPARLLDGDAWWSERRDVARKLLDKGDAATAYRLAAAGGARSAAGKIESAFLAGWIALRHVGGGREQATRARAHFDAAAAVATTPASSARAAYWQGRASEAMGETEAARAAYGAAAQRAPTFYGQLAAAHLGPERPKLRQAAATPDETAFTQVFRALYGAEQRALALPLALDAAKAGGRDGELAALSEWIARRRDARTALAIGKAALAAGGALDETAFPTYGVPAYAAAPQSADAAVVYAIARQESAFQTEAVSPAGAKGLMQMLDSTARETAKRAGLPFDERWMLSDPAFNAKLGAAHLGTLLRAQRGSYLLAFAAYNAGPGRVKEWIAAYGDPREPGVDPIDWIERIPIAETRDYVQKTLENLQIYRMRLGERTDTNLDADLRRGARHAAAR